MKEEDGELDDDAVALRAQFASLLRTLHDAAGKPPAGQLAALTGVSSRAIYAVLSGSRRPSRQATLALATAWGADAQALAEQWDKLDLALKIVRRQAKTGQGPSREARGCEVDGCLNRVQRGRYCSTHQRHRRLYGDPTAGRFSPKRHPTTCSAEGCDKPYRSRGLCTTHYRRSIAEPGLPL